MYFYSPSPQVILPYSMEEYHWKKEEGREKKRPIFFFLKFSMCLRCRNIHRGIPRRDEQNWLYALTLWCCNFPFKRSVSPFLNGTLRFAYIISICLSLRWEENGGKNLFFIPPSFPRFLKTTANCNLPLYSHSSRALMPCRQVQSLIALLLLILFLAGRETLSPLFSSFSFFLKETIAQRNHLKTATQKRTKKSNNDNRIKKNKKKKKERKEKEL
eukprot:TRINITY_DN881_c0_g3_i1.p1 TRINITY_DN881_c0_g3~~TRINITY_DN881_c0_g3_i1.p1  ORF type:complete len:215 (+),score=6.40 TRINITY_DN881_c0_g3_i1:247-891(+)